MEEIPGFPRVVIMPVKKIQSLVCFLLLLSSAGACRPEPRSNFDVGGWAGRTLDGKPLRLTEISARTVLLNFYSPTCQPCIEELPALELLKKEADRRSIPFYIALEPAPGAHGLTAAGSAESNFELVRNRMLEDVRKFRLTIPVLIMDEPFHIEPGSTTITGTPETVILATNPLQLKYNFIGPISMSEKPDQIAAETRYRFVLERL